MKWAICEINGIICTAGIIYLWFYKNVSLFSFFALFWLYFTTVRFLKPYRSLVDKYTSLQQGFIKWALL